jgi:hypothetical protein
LPGSLDVISWSDFKAQQPELASQGADLMYHYGVGLAFLGTVRADGGPRLHPMCPLLTDSGLYAFIVPSPKQIDLHRDGRYAMHSFPLENNEDAFYLSGVASHVSDPQIREPAGAAIRRRALRFGPGTAGRGAAPLRIPGPGGDAHPDHRPWRSRTATHHLAGGLEAYQNAGSLSNF